jgi:FkbM family methyltransferase
LLVRDKFGGHMVEVVPSRWADRWYVLLARPYDLPTVLTIRALLEPGQHAVDIGANVGSMALHMAQRVGPGGRVLAFEPHPAAFERLTRHRDRNEFGWMTPQNAACADRPGTLPLSVMDENFECSTLRRVAKNPTAGGHAAKPVMVEVVRADDVIESMGLAPTLIKIDVEGFETKVVRGLERTLRAHRPAIVTEIDDTMLRDAGSSAAEFIDLLASLGYEGRELMLTTGLRKRLATRPIDPARMRGKHDAVFVVRGGAADRAMGRIESG